MLYLEAPELCIPEVKPAIESIRGHWVQKMSPRRRHALLQGNLLVSMRAWAGERGEVGSEWRFYYQEPDETWSSFVPDVAYVSFERLPHELGELREQPTIMPDIAVEILSPGDKRWVFEKKLEIYFGGGSRGVVLVHPTKRNVTCYDSTAESTLYGEGTIARLQAFPDFALDVRKLFERI